MPKLIEGHMLADIVAVLGSLNIVAAELDRARTASSPRR
jgi:NADH:ubiquinone oxidoreductase subunit D